MSVESGGADGGAMREISFSREAEIEALKAIVNKVYFARKNHLQEDLFCVAWGIDPDTEEKFFERVGGEVGRNFDAHGIAKTNQLENLLALLQSGIDYSRHFSAAPFEIRDEDRAAASAMGTAGGTAYKDGMAVVVSGYGKSLLENGIEYVFINDVYAEMVPHLQKLFPQYKIHLLSQQKEVLESCIPL